MKIGESAEMYLETILLLSKKGDVHAIDIVRKMDFSRPTVSIAIHNLESHIFLEPKGLEIAQKIYERHTVLTEMLVKLGVSENAASEDACKIEHDISDETFNCIKKFVNENKNQ